MFDSVVRGGDVVTAASVVKADIGIEDGVIAEISPELSAGRVEVDASGLTVFAGVIDVHVHFNEPGRTEWEGAHTGSLAFSRGGGTLYFDMPLNSTPCTVDCAGFDAKCAALQAGSVTDFALWGGLIPGNLNQLAELGARGVVGLKAFLCDSGLPEFPRADDLTLHEGMKEAARLDLPVAVHAESQEITHGLTQRLVSQGCHDAAAFAASRPVIAEVEAIERAALIARETGCKLHVVHISSGGGVAAALEARARGTDITIETCPHYLFFNEDDLMRIGTLLKCAPPLRKENERQGLWGGLLRGEVDIVGSDHSPCPPELKASDNFFRAWGGIAGVQSTLTVLLDQAHRERGMSLPNMARMLSVNPAQRFRMRHKGEIAVGQEADLAIVDLNAANRLTSEDLLQRHKMSSYVGYDFRGRVVQTLLRGERVTAATRGKLVRPERK